MTCGRWTRLVAGVGLASTLLASAASAHDSDNVQVGPRPYYLIEKMRDPELRTQLQQCAARPIRVTDFSIGHRGAALQYPEHTKESYEAAARMGAGIIECDVTFTGDAQLVCRHAQCDLATTTNVLVTDLAGKCSEPFTPAEFDPKTGALTKPASAKCCTSDFSLAEFKTLCGKMDASNPAAKTPLEFLGGNPTWRTELQATYPVPTSPTLNPDDVCTGTLLTHKESIELIGGMGRKYTPELKAPEVPMPYSNTRFGVSGFSQQDYAQKMIDEYKAAGVPPRKVWAQSFDLGDVLYWIRSEPAFGQQAVYLEDAEQPADLPNRQQLQSYADSGVRILGSPLFSLVALDANGRIVPSLYARDARAAALDIIGWTFERSAPVQQMKDGRQSNFYYQTVLDALVEDGDIYEVLDVIAQDVGAIGVFSDWPDRRAIMRAASD
jgi:glycerophosphoryl diester phosphodiesterase